MQGSDTSFKNKMRKVFSFMCSRPVMEEPQTNLSKSPRVSKKENRQTILIEDVFVKKSRKNIVEEEFFTNDILNLQMEKHLFLRTKGATFGLVKGDFSQEVYQGIKFPIFLESKPVNTLPFREQFLTTSTVKIRQNTADILLYQTSLTIDKPKKKTKQNPVMLEIKEIEEVLKTYRKSVANIVVLCSASLDLEILRPILAQYSDFYLYELENIRKNQELVCNVIYMASSAKFLKLNNSCFMNEVIQQMGLSLEDEERMEKILSTLIENNFHKEIRQIVSTLLIDKSVPRHSRFSQFILRAGEHQGLRSVISGCKDIVFKEEPIQETPVLQEPTPAFQPFQ